MAILFNRARNRWISWAFRAVLSGSSLVRASLSSGRHSILGVILLVVGLSAFADTTDRSVDRHEIVFIESNVADYAVLEAGAARHREVHILDARQDGLVRMAEILSNRHGLDAIHLVSHGAPGAIDLGSAMLSHERLAVHREQMATIAAALNAGGALLLYGCDIAKGTIGKRFIAELAETTHARVAASTNSTGLSARGGDWELEARIGQIQDDASVFGDAVNHYEHLLANYTFTFGNGTTTTYLEGGYELDFNVAGSDFIGDFYYPPDRWSVQNSSLVTTITLTITLAGHVFDLTSIDMTNETGASGDCPLTITTSKDGNYSGSVTAQSGSYDTFSFSYAGYPKFYGISSFTIAFTGIAGAGMTAFSIDNLALYNITAISSIPAPSVGGLSPIIGPAGTMVTITGTGLFYAQGSDAVKFGGTNASSYTIVSDTQITATAPSGTGTVDVTVTTLGGTSATSSADQFTYGIAPTAPTATTGAASGITATTATLNGTVNDNGADTAPVFEYGTSTSYDFSATATPSLVSAGMGNAGVTAAVANLACNTTYHYRVAASNSVGTTNGNDTTFKTAACVPGAPAIGSATAGDGSALVAFAAPGDDGGATITLYTATSNPGGFTGTGTSSPITVNGLTNGTSYTFTVTATNSAGTGPASTASGSVTPKAAQTITFTNPGSQSFGTTPTLTATATSDLPVAFTSSTTSVCTITTGGVLTFATIGTCTIHADQDGNSAYLAATTVTWSFTVNPVVPDAPTIGTAIAGDAQASVSFSAPASNGGATITVYTATSNPGGFTGTGTSSPITVTGLTNGTSYTFTVTATNSAGTGPASAASGSVTPKAAQTITFTNPGPRSFGTTPTLTATATSGLPVTFSSSTSSVCSITSGGSLSFVAVGTCTIHADQDGDGAYLAATTVTRSFTVNPVVPDAPTIGTAIAGNAQATVSFFAPASNGGATITGYTVTSNPGGLTGTSAASPITMLGLTNGISYTFTVTATNSAGTGPASTASGSVTPAAVPGAPTIGTATAGNAQATVSFTAPDDTGGAAIIGYTVLSNPGEITATGTSSPITVTGLTNGTSYTFTVTATNSAGTGPASGASNSVTPATVPGTATIGTATAGNAQATVNFTAPIFDGGAAITGYTVTSSPGENTATGTASPITVTGLTNGTSYTFTVTATNSVGTGPASPASNSVTPATIPDPPTIGMATASDGNATVLFTAPSSNGGAAITGYTVTSSPGGITVTGAGSPISVTGLTNGFTYTFTVTATNSAGTSAASAPSNEVTPIANASKTVQYVQFANPGPQIFGTTLTLVATATSGLAVTFSSSTGSVCTTTSGGALTLLRLGTCAINAGQTGDDTYAAAPTVIQNFIVTPAVPGSPTIDKVTAGDGQAVVAFSAPTFDGGETIVGYSVASSPGGISATGTTSPITVAGLANGTAYTFTVTAMNGAGTGSASSASNVVIPSPGGRVLIVYEGTGGTELEVLANWATNGNNLTVTAQGSLPASLAGYDQIWDIRSSDSSALSSSDQTAYLHYLQTGGLLYLAGESLSTGARDTSLMQLIGAAGGGTISLATSGTTQTVHPPFTGPIALSSLSYGTVCGAASSGNGASITDDGLTSSAIVWTPGTLSQALAGGLITVFDVDFMRGVSDGSSRTFLANLVSYQTRVSKMSPAVANVTGPSGSYKAGSVLDFTVGYSGAVTVTGTPRLPLTIGSAAAWASYSTGSGTTALVFAYTVKSGDDGTVALAADLDLTNGGTLRDADGFPARVRLNQVSLAGITLDTTPPRTPTITQITGTSIAGTAEAGSTVNIYLEGILVASIVAAANEAWSTTLPLNQSGTLTVSASDQVGNASIPSSGVGVDTAVPVANSISTTVSSNSSGNVVPLDIKNATATRVAIARDAVHGGTVVNGISISYTPTAGYSGADSFTYTASNANGTSAVATVTILVIASDFAPPSVRLSMLSDGAVTSDSLLNVSGVIATTNGISSVMLGGVALSMLPDGRFSHPVRLASGANTITLVVTDKAGRTTTETRTVTLDTSAPTLELSQPPDGLLVTESALMVAGTASFLPTSTDSLSSVAYTLNGGDSQMAKVSNNAFSFSVDLAAGLNTLEVIATTTAGKIVRCKRTAILEASLALKVTDPRKDVLVTAGSYLLKGEVASKSVPLAVTVSVGGQAYTPTVSNGLFAQSLTLDANKVWPVLVTATDAEGHTTTVLRNLVKVATTDAGAFTIADANRALEIANGLATTAAEDLAKYDVAPMLNGVSTGDGVIDIEDAEVILWLASGRSL